MGRQSLRILHTNDLHGSLTDWRIRSLMPVRRDCDLYFDTGDCIKSGNLAIPIRPEDAWRGLSELECTASVPGNRESHILKSAFDAKIAGHGHPIVCCNLHDRNGNLILPPWVEIDCQGIRIGILGVMVPMVTERMAAGKVSQLIWTPPVAAAVEVATAIRKSCDLVIALTHIGLRQDQSLAESTDAIDLILGGHSHSVLESPTRIGNRWICQGGSHGRYYGKYRWQVGTGLVEGGLHEWTRGLA